MPRRGHKTMKKRGTSRTRSSIRVLTIPELRQSMDYITNYSTKLIRSGKQSIDDLAIEFAKEWKKVFGKSLNPKIAKSYIKHIMVMKKGTRRKQRGGSTLAGAPIDYMTRPGVSLPYGNFLEYVQKGFWNPEPAILQDCGKQTGVLPSATVGTNLVGKQEGGGILDFVRQSADAITFRPFIAQNPLTPQQQGMMAWKGQSISPGPESWQQAWTPKMTGQPLPPLSAIATYERDIKTDVITR